MSAISDEPGWSQLDTHSENVACVAILADESHLVVWANKKWPQVTGAKIIHFSKDFITNI